MEPRSARPNFTGASICGALALLFSLILLWHDSLVFWNDDYQISILPVFDDVARSWREGHWPLLSPYSWVCGNLAGEFQYGTFSVFVNGAVIIIWRIFTEFAHQAAALSIVHLIVLTAGGFVLARSRGVSMQLAVMVALIAALNGWIICWGASDWFGALGAFAWLPWAWWGLEKALGAAAVNGWRRDELVSSYDYGGHRPPLRQWRFIWPTPFVYLVATGGFPYTIVMLAVLIGWLTIRSAVATKSVWAPLPMLLGAALGFGLAAPAILALLAHVHGSLRESQPAAAHWQWIVPPGALPGLILPSWTVKWADFSTRYRPHTGTELACGVVAPVAVLCGLAFRTRLVFRRIGWELGLLGLVLIATMLPTTGVFRWSFRWLPFFHLILALCAAECLMLLGRPKLVSTAALVLAVAAMAGMKIFGTEGTFAFPLTWILLIVLAGWTALDFAASSQSQTSNWLPATVTFVLLLATYLCISPNCGVPRYSFIESLINPEPLDPARLYLSVYPGPEIAYRTDARPRPAGQIVRPGSTSMWARLRFVNGYSPIRPAGVARQWFAYIHGDFDPASERWLLSQQAGPTGALADLGVDGIVMAKEINLQPEPADEWELAFSNDEGRVFHRRGPPLGLVRSVQSVVSQPNKLFTIATISGVQDLRNSIAADVDVPKGDAPALLSFSRPYFNDYAASLAGRSLNVGSDRGLYPTVEVPAGSRGRLVLKYRPAWLIYGGAIALTCTAFWLGGVIAVMRRQHMSQSWNDD